MMVASLRGELTRPDHVPLFALGAPTLIERVSSALMASSLRFIHPAHPF
jgi:hypothetical protein